MGAGGAETGVLLFDKPAGVTSHDVVAAQRRERGVKAGHAGTLDPFATGLLLVLLGRATRLQTQGAPSVDRSTLFPVVARRLIDGNSMPRR